MFYLICSMFLIIINISFNKSVLWKTTQLLEEMLAIYVSANHGHFQTLHFLMLQLHVCLANMFTFCFLVLFRHKNH